MEWKDEEYDGQGNFILPDVEEFTGEWKEGGFYVWQ